MSDTRNAMNEGTGETIPLTHACPVVREGSSMTGKSFPILTRPTEPQESKNCQCPDAISESGKGNQETFKLPERIPSFQIGSLETSASSSRYLASTPPPEETPVTQSQQLVTGAGCLFPSLPPSRASSLTVCSEGLSEYSTTERPGTPFQGQEDTDENDESDLTTPVAAEKAPGKGILLTTPVTLWTPPDSTRKRQGKRTSSPPSSPRPIKLTRPSGWRVPRDMEDEGYFEGVSRELETQQAFRNVQERGFALAELQNTSPRRHVHIFGSALAEEAEKPGFGDVFTGSSSSTAVTAVPDSEDPFRTASISTSVNGQYGQDELVIQVEYFTEDEIESQLSDHLSSYRATYLDLDEPDRQGRDTTKAELAQSAFQTVCAGRISWEDTEAILKEEEEEDILDQFMIWVKGMDMPSSAQTETFLDIEGCLRYLKKLTISSSPGPEIRAWPFVRKIKLSSNGCIDRFLDGLPEIRGVKASSPSLDGTTEWEFAKIYCGLGEHEIPDMVAAWDKLVIRGE